MHIVITNFIVAASGSLSFIKYEIVLLVRIVVLGDHYMYNNVDEASNSEDCKAISQSVKSNMSIYI